MIQYTAPYPLYNWLRSCGIAVTPSPGSVMTVVPCLKRKVPCLASGLVNEKSNTLSQHVSGGYRTAKGETPFKSLYRDFIMPCLSQFGDLITPCFGRLSHSAPSWYFITPCLGHLEIFIWYPSGVIYRDFIMPWWLNLQRLLDDLLGPTWTSWKPVETYHSATSYKVNKCSLENKKKYQANQISQNDIVVQAVVKM